MRNPSQSYVCLPRIRPSKSICHRLWSQIRTLTRYYSLLSSMANWSFGVTILLNGSALAPFALRQSSCSMRRTIQIQSSCKSRACSLYASISRTRSWDLQMLRSLLYNRMLMANTRSGLKSDSAAKISESSSGVVIIWLDLDLKITLLSTRVWKYSPNEATQTIKLKANSPTLDNHLSRMSWCYSSLGFTSLS